MINWQAGIRTSSFFSIATYSGPIIANNYAKYRGIQKWTRVTPSPGPPHWTLYSDSWNVFSSPGYGESIRQTSPSAPSSTEGQSPPPFTVVYVSRSSQLWRKDTPKTFFLYKKKRPKLKILCINNKEESTNSNNIAWICFPVCFLALCLNFLIKQG